jgi:putative ABC transport system permease protein
MLHVAIAMLLHRKARFVSASIGIAVAFFLSAAQIGMMVGWCNTNSAIVRHADADVWIMAQHTCAFDYGTAIPRHRIDQVRSASGVEWAEGMIMLWMYWTRPDGRAQNVEIVGLDESLVGGPWRMREGALSAVQEPDSVIVDALYLKNLGVQNIGDEVEMLGRRAILRGVSEEVRTFTAAPFVFTSLESAIRYDPRYSGSQVTYVLARCADGWTPEQTRDAISSVVPSVEVLTSEEFALRTIKYWMLETGIGLTVITTAVLGLVVSAVIMSQTLYTLTNEHLANYGTLAALGFSHRQLGKIVIFQSLLLGTVGISLGGLLFAYGSTASATTPIPIEMTPRVFTALVLISILSSVAASLMSVRAIYSIDPVSVFNG